MDLSRRYRGGPLVQKIVFALEFSLVGSLLAGMIFVLAVRITAVGDETLRNVQKFLSQSIVSSAHAAPMCEAPEALLSYGIPLLRVRQKMAAEQPLKIVAIGSSSTSGAGSSDTSRNYPSRLAVELGKILDVPITVINHGINGDDEAGELKRFPRDVLAEHPDLVVWQVGTNALLRDENMNVDLSEIETGIEELKAAHTDIFLVDVQFAPKVLSKKNVSRFINDLESLAWQQKVNLFGRFKVMIHWHEKGLTDEDMLSPDGLHMNDWSYGCMAKLLAKAIAETSR